MKIEDVLFDYFYHNPSKDIDDLMILANTAYEKSRREVIPVYKPRKIEDLNGVSDEYDANSKVIIRERYQDESTFDDYE